MASADMEAKHSAATALVQVLTDRLLPAEQQHGEEDDRYHSYKLHLHEADCTSGRYMDVDVRITIEHTLQTLSPAAHQTGVDSLYGSMTDSIDLWQKWQALISLLAELAVRILLII